MKKSWAISFFTLMLSFAVATDELGQGRIWEATKACDSAIHEMQRQYEALVKQNTPPSVITPETWQDAIGKDANKKKAACNVVRESLGLPRVVENDKKAPGQLPSDLRQAQSIRKAPTQPSALEGLPKEVKPLIVGQLDTRDAKALKNVNRATSDDTTQIERKIGGLPQGTVDGIIECPKVAEVKNLPVGKVLLSNSEWISMSTGDPKRLAKLSRLTAIEFLEDYHACVYKDDSDLFTRRIQRNWYKDAKKRVPNPQSCRPLNEQDVAKLTSRFDHGRDMGRVRTVFEAKQPSVFIPEGIKFVCSQFQLRN